MTELGIQSILAAIQFMLSAVAIIVSGLTGGLAGAVINHFLTLRRDRARCCGGFKGYARCIIAEFNGVNMKALSQGDLFARHQATIVGIRTEGAKVFDSICECRRPEFEAAWVAYCGLREQDVEPYDHYDPVTNPQAILGPNYARGLDRVIALLESMIESAK